MEVSSVYNDASASNMTPSVINDSSFGNMTSFVFNDTSLGNMTSLDVNDTNMTSESATGASIVSPIVMFLTGLVGNVLALMVLHKTKTEIRSMMFYTLVAALTWNDLIGICLTSPPVLASYLNHRQMPALPTLCRFHALAMVCFGLSTPFIVCTMAIERSLALKCSYFYSKYCTPSSARLLVALLWAFVLFFGALPLFDLGSFTLQYPQTWCFLDFRATLPLNKAYAYAYAIINLVVVAVMVFCNGLVMTTLCRVRKTRRMSNASVNSTLLNTDAAVDECVRTPQQTRRRHHRDVELQMIWLLCAITTIFSVCWVPLMAYIIFCLQSPNHSAPVFGLVAVRLASLNQTLNPWIYVILRKSLLSRLRKLCHECFLCDDDLDSPRPLRKPLTHYPRIQMRPEQVRGRPNNYVHVRHQLCPSSQYVGQQNEGASLTEGHRRSKGSGSSSRSRSQGGSQGSYSVCSICRARMRMERLEGGGQDSFSSFTPTLSQDSKSNNCSLLASPVCSATCNGSAEHAEQPLFLFTEDNPNRMLPRLPNLAQDSSSESSVVCRRQSGRSGVTSAANIPSYISEADDHGYSSKVSTDSSRMSTPERPQSTCRGPSVSVKSQPEQVPARQPYSSSEKETLGARAVKQNNSTRHRDRADDSIDPTSGVFDSQENDCEVDEMDVADTNVVQGDRLAVNRTVSCSSGGAPSDSSSSQDRSTVVQRHLSSSSGQ